MFDSTTMYSFDKNLKASLRQIPCWGPKGESDTFTACKSQDEGGDKEERKGRRYKQKPPWLSGDGGHMMCHADTTGTDEPHT